MDESDNEGLPLSLQAWRSIFRTIFYSLLIAALLLWGQHGSSTVSAVLTGFLFGDYLTWLVRTAPTALTKLLHGAWQTTVNVVAAVVLYRVCGMNIPRSGEEVAISFLAFLLILAVKVTYYAVAWVDDVYDDK